MKVEDEPDILVPHVSDCRREKEGAYGGERGAAQSFYIAF
jgi:hypothetical protein